MRRLRFATVAPSCVTKRATPWPAMKRTWRGTRCDALPGAHGAVEECDQLIAIQIAEARRHGFNLRAARNQGQRFRRLRFRQQAFRVLVPDHLIRGAMNQRQRYRGQTRDEFLDAVVNAHQYDK